MPIEFEARNLGSSQAGRLCTKTSVGKGGAPACPAPEGFVERAGSFPEQKAPGDYGATSVPVPREFAIASRSLR